MELEILDYGVIILLLFGVINGFRKGFILQLMGIAALIIAIFVSMKFSDLTEDFLNNKDWLPDSIRSIAALVITFVLSFILVQWISKALDKTIRTLGLGLFNRLAGAVLGGLLNLIVLGVILFYLHSYLPTSITDSQIIDWIYKQAAELKTILFD